jgi:hypothetical protein
MSTPRKSLLSLLGIIGLVLALAGCDAGDTTGSDSSAGGVVHHPHRPPTFTQACPQASPEYDAGLTKQAQGWLADGLAAAVRENTEPLTLSVSYIDQRPLEPSSSPLLVKVPAIDAYPPAPKLQEVPTPNPDTPFGSGPDDPVQKAQDDNEQTMADYNAGVAKVNAQISAARTAIQPQVEQLRTLTPPANLVGARPSIWGCVWQAAQRFQQVDGVKILFLASTMDERNFKDVADLAGLQGAHVIVGFHKCVASASWCDRSAGTWKTVFTKAHVASQRWLDPAASLAAGPGIVFDAGIPAS